MAVVAPSPDAGRFGAPVAGAWLDRSVGWEPVVGVLVAEVEASVPLVARGIWESEADWAPSSPPHAATNSMIPVMSAVLRTR